MDKVFCKSLNSCLAKIMKVSLLLVFLTVGAFIFVIGKDEIYLAIALFLVFCTLLVFLEEYNAVRKWKKQRSYVCKVFFNLCAIILNIAVLVGAALFFNKVFG